MSGTDDLYLWLKGARERLCRAQVVLPPAHIDALRRALDEIDLVATYHCPQWSRFDVPILAHLDDPLPGGDPS